MIDSTITHACAPDSDTKAEAGGFITQIHAITDGLGKPLDFILTAGQGSNVGQGNALL
jgi:hypothetical protein